MLLLKSVNVGIVAAIALGGLSFGAAFFFNFDAVGLYVAPARLVLPVLGPSIPSRWIYVVPNGGAAAGILLILVSALLPWTLFFGGIYFAWAALKRRRATAERTEEGPA
jgi:hypothetical protein